MYRTLLPVAFLILAAGCVPEDRWNARDDSRPFQPRAYPGSSVSMDKRALNLPAVTTPAPSPMPELAIKKDPVLPPTPVPAVTTAVAKADPVAKPDPVGTLPVSASTPKSENGPLLTPPPRTIEQLSRLPDVEEPSTAKAAKPKTPATPSVECKDECKEMAVRVLNGKHLRLGYEVKQTEAGMPIPVEMWYTRDSKTWHRDEGPPQVRSPYVMDLPEEGVYGLTLVPCRAGTKDPQPPQPGDAPQFWVAVDCTRPNVSLMSATVDSAKNSVCVRWSAQDEHFGMRPITLSWSEQATGPWAPLAANLANTGTYTGALPAHVSGKLYVRVEAADQAGNIGEAHSMTPVSLETSACPRVVILGVDVSTE
jgi:hypothetical protein